MDKRNLPINFKVDQVCLELRQSGLDAISVPEFMKRFGAARSTIHKWLVNKSIDVTISNGTRYMSVPQLIFLLEHYPRVIRVRVETPPEVYLQRTIRALRQRGFNKNLARPQVPKNAGTNPGVSWDRTVKKWRAIITVQGSRYHLGAYTRKADAIRARKKVEKLIFKT